MSSEKKLLIIHHGALGDVVLAFPAILRLRDGYGRIDAVCQKKIGDIAHRLDLIDNGIDIESSFLARIYNDDPSDTQAADLLQRYDRIIVFSFSRQLENTLNHLAGNTTLRIPPRPGKHEKIDVSDYIVNCLAEQKLVGTAETTRNLILKWRSEHAGCFKTTDPRKVIIHPGSGSRRKNWPFDYFLQTADFLKSHGLEVEFIFGPAEGYLSEALSEGLASRMRSHVTADLNAIWSLFTSAGFYLGNDSGLSHLAAFAGLPTVVIFGPSDPARWAPVGRLVKVVIPDLDCRPCFEDRHSALDCRECLMQLRPETVNAAMLELIKRTATE